jgi:hypothetical protein
MFKQLERMNKLMNALSEEERKLFTENRFPYILTKADLYLKIGPEKYRRQDFFGMPDMEWDNDELKVIADGCRQILEGKGFTPEKPFVGLDIRGFTQLFSLFHFEKIGRETSNPGEGKFLDKIKMRHVVDGGEVTYYNLVEYDIDKSGNS